MTSGKSGIFPPLSDYVPLRLPPPPSCCNSISWLSKKGEEKGREGERESGLYQKGRKEGGKREGVGKKGNSF